MAQSEGLDIGIPHTDQACVNDSQVATGLCEVARWHERPDSATRTAVVPCNEMLHGEEISVAVSTPARCRLSSDEPTCKPIHCWLCVSFCCLKQVLPVRQILFSGAMAPTFLPVRPGPH